MYQSRHIDVLPYRADHYLGLIEKSQIRFGRGDLGYNPARAAVIYETGGPAFSGFIDGRLIMCGGVLIPWRGFGEAWALAGEIDQSISISVHLRAKQIFESIIFNGNFRRVQADVDTSFYKGRKWVQALGFRWESDMPNFGPNGETFVRFVLFPGEGE